MQRPGVCALSSEMVGTSERGNCLVGGEKKRGYIMMGSRDIFVEVSGLEVEREESLAFMSNWSGALAGRVGPLHAAPMKLARDPMFCVRAPFTSPESAQGPPAAYSKIR